MRKRLSLEELELTLPKIELRETKFLLGGTGYTVDDPDLPNPPTTWPGTEPEDPTSEDPTNNDPVDDDIDIDIGTGDDDQDQGQGDDDPYQGGTDGQDQGQDPGNPDDGQHDDPDYQDPDYGDPDDQNPDNPNDSQDPSNGSNINFNFPFFDGVDSLQGYTINFENIDLLDNFSGQSAIQEQLNVILESNSVLAGLIDSINSSGRSIVFNVADGDDEFASTEPNLNPNNTEYEITLNWDEINSDGWANNSNQFGGPYNNESESLVNTIVHEVLHAYMQNLYADAVTSVGQNGLSLTPDNVYNELENTHGIDFANAFYNVQNVNGNETVSPITDSDDFSEAQHEYMENNYTGIIDNAVNEFTSDAQNLQAHLDDLYNQIEQAESNQDQDLYTDLYNQINHIHQNYDWLLDLYN